jgi:WD40 repeat protein
MSEPVLPDDPTRPMGPRQAEINPSNASTVDSGAGSGQVDLEQPGISGYEALEILGRGGMGIVWKARQQSLNRIVALKVLLVGAAATPEERHRFRAEAEAIAHLDHPNIVRVFDVGEQGGRAYLSLEFVEGGSLARKLEAGPLTAREAASLLETLANAVQYAHERNLIHRDLKPANVLLASNDHPKIADFGLVKRLDADSGLTHTGAVMGTPSYMPPEQALGQRDLGPRVDIYSLGAILYECLTGRAPFLAATVLETIEQVRSQEPVAPRTLNPAIPRDLETICLKCLRKEPAQRYLTARELALDLRRFLDGEPILARPAGLLERTWARARRNPLATLAVALTALALLLGVGGGLALWLYQSSENARQQETKLREEAQKFQHLADLARGEAEKAAGLAEAANNRTARLLAAQTVRGTILEWQAGRESPARDLLMTVPEERRSWEWHYVQRMLHSPQETGGLLANPDTVAFTPDSKGIITLHLLDGMRRWDAATGRESFFFEGTHPRSPVNGGPIGITDANPRRFLLGPNPGEVVSGVGDGPLQVYDLATGKKVRLIQDGVGVIAKTCLAADPKGTWLAFGSGGANFLAPGVQFVPLDGKPSKRLPWPNEMAVSLAVSPNGKFLAAGGDHGNLRVWDSATHAVVFDQHIGPSWVVGVAFRPNLEHLLVVTESGMIRAFHVGAWRDVFTLNLRPRRLGPVAYHPDSQRFAVGTNLGEVLTFEARDGQEAEIYRGHAGIAPQVRSLAYSPDGHWLVSGGGRSIRVWDVTRPQENGWRRLDVPTNEALALDGTTLQTGGTDGTLRRWRMPSGEPLGHQHLVQGEINRLALARGCERSAASSGGEVVVWDWGAKRELCRQKVPAERLGVLALSADGRLLVAAYAGDGFFVRAWDVDSGKPVTPMPTLTKALVALTLSPDGRYLAGRSDEGLIVWEVSTARAVFRAHDTIGLGQLEFSGDGNFLAQMTPNSVRVWRTSGWTPVLTGQNWGTKLALAFMPDSSRLITASNEVVLWDLVTGSRSLVFPGQTSPVALMVTPDSSTIVGASHDGTIVTWEGKGERGASAP